MKPDFALLKTLCAIPGTSGNEAPVKDFILRYIKKEQKGWKVKPEIFHGDDFQDSLVLKFGKPRTAVFAHMDTIGFTVRYFNQLVPIGGPDAEAGARLVGRDSKGEILCELDYDKEQHALYKFGRVIDRGTALSYQVNFKDKKDSIESAYLDDRLGIYVALQLAATLTDGIIIFSCWEEHGGGGVPFLAKFIYEKWNVRQALISDITWVSDGVDHGKGVVISLRDRNIPRRQFVDRVIAVADKHSIDYQLEVEGTGSSDGGELQRSPYPFDWCFVGAPHQHPHTPHETVFKNDIVSMINLYRKLMKEL
ncbi:MAG: aminopeptidase [Cyclobacteriaceae bacterium]|nr:aminopeptidase [Cyclobacteriaceae bacterium]